MSEWTKYDKIFRESDYDRLRNSSKYGEDQAKADAKNVAGLQDEYFDNTPFPVPEKAEAVKIKWIEANKKFQAELALCKKRLDNPGVKYRIGRCCKCKEWTEVGNSCCGEEYVRED